MHAQTLGGYFQCYKTPTSFLRAIQSFQKFYPDSTIVVNADGGHDYSYFCEKNGIHYTYYPKEVVHKALDPNGSVFVFSTMKPVYDFIHRMWTSFPKYKESHLILLEDDVRVIKHNYNPFVYTINGINTRTLICDELITILENKGYNGKFHYGGCGGCVFDKTFLEQIPFADIDILLKSLPPLKKYTPDELFTFIALYFGGSIGPYSEFAETWYPNSKQLCDEGTIAFLHQYKNDYKTPPNADEALQLGDYIKLP